MKKIVFIILSLFAFVAYADNTITSKEYVDGQVSTLQTQIPAKNTNTVVMNTGTAGTIGEKAIYDTTAAYGAQSDALVTAGAFNSAMQNALESEFVCVEWQGSVHDNAHCLLYEVRGATQTQTLPAGYTQLEYITVSNAGIVLAGTVFNLGTDFELEFVWQQTKPTNSFAPVLCGNYKNGAWFGGYNIQRFVIRTYNGYNFVLASIPVEMTKYKITRVGNEFAVYYNDILQGSNTINEFVYDSLGTYTIFADIPETSHYTNFTKGVLKYIKFNANHYLLPVKRNSDDAVGLYDTKNNTFYTQNIGTGEFIAGPVVSSNLYLPSGN